MEFIKVGNNYMIKGSNGRIVSEKEKLQLENKEMVIKDFESNNCQKETTKKISKNKKKIKEIEKANKKALEEYAKNIEESWNEPALEKEGESADDTIEETNNII